ncbi:monocarboxylate transporter 12-like, partial [Ruditapes philippinarum]|uniref:monocarboxylate transporter 12-like n=1 Tax=Ruditapes philippinarum TaxID=129788 RepID=UPI00295B43B1
MTDKELELNIGLDVEKHRIKKEAEKEKRKLLDNCEINQEINNETEEVKGGAPVDRGWAWVILAACVFEIIIYGGLLRSLGVFFLQYQTRFNSNASETALMSL